MLLLNFTHPLTAAHHRQIEALAGQAIDKTLGEPFQFDPAADLAPQATTLVERLGLTPEEWQGVPILVNLPGHAAAAASVLAELHGRMGHFPTIIRLRPVEGAPVTTYAVAEIINLQAQRDQARTRRLPKEGSPNDMATNPI